MDAKAMKQVPAGRIKQIREIRRWWTMKHKNKEQNGQMDQAGGGAGRRGAWLGEAMKVKKWPSRSRVAS